MRRSFRTRRLGPRWTPSGVGRLRPLVRLRLRSRWTHRVGRLGPLEQPSDYADAAAVATVRSGSRFARPVTPGRVLPRLRSPESDPPRTRVPPRAASRPFARVRAALRRPRRRRWRVDSAPTAPAADGSRSATARPGSSSHGTSPSGRVAQVHDQRGESVGETARGRGVAGGVELVDEDLQALLAVARLMA